MEENTSPVAAPQPQSLSEFRAAKAARNAAPSAASSENTTQAVESTENEGVSAKPAQEPQKQEQKRTARTAEERAADLRAAGRTREADKILADDAEKKEYESWKASKADRERDAEELRKYRAQPPAAPAAPPVSRESTSIAAPVAADPNRPKLTDFLKKPENKDRDYSEIVEQWKDADDDWKESKRQANEAHKRVASTIQERTNAARQKYADFESILNLPIARQENIATILHDFENGWDTIYHVAKDESLRQRILGLSPAMQLVELGYVAKNLSSNGTVQTPEKPRPAPPVSRTPPPVRSLSGGISPKEEKHDTPRTFSEFKAAKAARRAS